MTSVWGANVDIECDSCQTVNDFENAALSDYPNNGEGDLYFVVNFSAGLVGEIRVKRQYEPEVHKWIPNIIVPITTTQADLSELYQKMIPTALAPVGIPLDDGTTFTGDAQAAAVQDFLHSHFSGQIIAANTIVLVVFSDNSTAEYQLTDLNNQLWSFVSGSGVSASGQPLTDQGQPAPLPSPVKHPLPVPDPGPGFSSGTLGAQSFLDSFCGQAFSYSKNAWEYNCFVTYTPYK